MSFYDAFSDALFRHCYFRIGNREMAKDCMQEAFTRTWEYLSHGKKVDNPRAFLYKVANNLIIDEARKRKPVSLDELYERGAALEKEQFDPIDQREAIAASIEAKEVMKVLKELDPKYRDVIIMRYVDGFGPREIAEMWGESENVISVRLYRATRALRKIMPHDDE